MCAGLASRPLYADAAPPIFPNLVKNPGLDLDANGDGVPDGWLRTGSSPIPPDPAGSRAKGGKKGASLRIEAEHHVTWSSRVEGIKPGRHYLLTFRVKREGMKEGEYPFLRVFGKETRMKELFSWNAWRKVAYVLKAGPDSRTVLSFSGRGLSDGISFDKVEMREIAFRSLSPSDGSETRGTTTISWKFPPSDLVFRFAVDLFKDPLFITGASPKTARFEILNSQGSGITIRKRLSDGTWYWRVRAFLAAEEVAQSPVMRFTVKGDGKNPSFYTPKSKRFYSSAPPSSFFPISIFSADPKSFAELKEAGFNSIQSYIRKIMQMSLLLDAAAKNGLRALIRVPSINYKPIISSFIRRAGASSALLGWYLADEPEGHGMSPLTIRRLGDYVQRLAPFHPTSLALLRSHMARYYGPAVDFLLLDPYPIPTQPITWISDSIDEARAAIGPKSAVWTIIQAFNWGYDSGYPKDWPGRFPTFIELRAMTYLAIAHGSRGIFFFDEPTARKNSGNWDNVKKLARELRCLYPILSSRKTPNAPVLVSPEIGGNGKPSIHYLMKRVDRKIIPPMAGGCRPLKEGNYLIAVNASKKQVAMRLRNLGGTGSKAIDLFSGNISEFQTGEMRKTFKSHESGVWRIE